MEENEVHNTNCDVEISGSIEPLPEIDDIETMENLLRAPVQGSLSSDDSSLLTAWSELRTSLRQLHRTIIPSPQSNKWQNSLKMKPSVSRIKYLSNILLSHDPHQLFTRLSLLSQELCIELKVRLLNTVVDNPTSEEAKTFVHGLCESYQWVMNICDAAQSGLEKLDTDHLSMFGLNWISVNMHAFYTTVFTDPDVQDYLSVCSDKLKEGVEYEKLDFLLSLQRTLLVAEEVWGRAEINLHRYTQQMGNPRRITDVSCTHENCNSLDVKQIPANSTVNEDNSNVVCPCRSCMTEADSKSVSSVSQAISIDVKNTSKPCDCHFCNTANVNPPPAVGSNSEGPLPPISQPQLSLYPHIHGTSSDLNNTQSLDDLMRSSTGTNKVPHIPNHLLGSELLTQQLLREWEMVYGDAISQPASRPYCSVPSFSRSDQSVLVNGMQSLTLDKQVPDSMPGSNVYMVNNVSSVIPNSLLTTTVSSHQISNMITTSSGFIPISTLNGPEAVASRDVDHRTMNGNSGVITHTKYSVASNSECDHRQCSQIHFENSTTAESSSMCDSSERDEENELTSDYEPYSSDDSSPEHQENHCDCCYCHLLDGQQGGGRQRYHDRRERLLKLLARKKAMMSSSSSSNNSGAPAATSTQTDQDINQIMNYIEGRRESCEKKILSTKKPRKKKEVYKKSEHGSQERKSRLGHPKKSVSNEEEEEDEDGPLAELRRRAPDVTITVVKPGDRPPMQDKMPPRSQIRISRNSENRGVDPPHPLMVRNQQTNANETWVPPTSRIGASFSGMGFQDFNFQGERNFTVDKSTASLLSQNSGQSQGATINTLLKNMQPANGNASKNKDGSQMVTIKRVMDPVTADPTVTITLKGAKKKNDEVLLKLINGQAVGKNNAAANNEPYVIPEGLSAEQAKKYKNRLRKERRKERKDEEKRQEEEEDKMQQMHLQKQQQLLLQQEKQIKKQQMALQRQQAELIRQQQQKSGITPKGGITKKGPPPKKINNFTTKNKKDAKNLPVDMSRNYTLPPGVSINKVAGQPGMVTISNNLGGPQPFLSNPNVFANSFNGGYRIPEVAPSFSMATPYSYEPSWNENNSRKENVIVVDTKAASKNKKETISTKNVPVISKKDAKPVQTVKAKAPPVVTKKNTKTVSVKKDQVLTKKDMKAQFLTKETKVNTSKKKDNTKVTKKELPAVNKNVKNIAVVTKENKVNIKNEVKPSLSKKEKKKLKEPRKMIEDMTAEERINGALHGEIDPTLLKKIERKKMRRRLTMIEAAAAEQKEEDELMDKMHKISVSSNVKPAKNPAKSQQVAETNKKQSKGQQSVPVVKRLQKSNQPKPEVSKVKSKVELIKEKGKNQPKKVEELKKQISKEATSNNRKNELTKHITKNVQKMNTVPQKTNTFGQKINAGVQKTNTFVPKTNSSVPKTNSSVQKTNTKPINNMGATRKQQFLKAQQALEKRQEDNRSVIINTNKKTFNKQGLKEDEGRKQKGKASKKNSLDDMTIDSIFTPKYNAANNLDETEREVEAFKRFCFENTKRNCAEKPKIKFDVKDIRITKKYGLD